MACLKQTLKKINNFLEEEDNDDFEITKIKELKSGEILITVSDI